MEITERVTYTVQVHREDDGSGMWATVVELPGLFASGDTAEELDEALAEAIGMYLSSDGVQIEAERLRPAEDVQVRREEFALCHS